MTSLTFTLTKALISVKKYIFNCGAYFCVAVGASSRMVSHTFELFIP